jgi:hypothetical protein
MTIFGFCKIVNATIPVINGSGVVIQQSRTTPPFSGIRIEVNSDIQVSQVPDQSILFSGEDNILALLHCEVKDNILVISSDEKYIATKPLRISIASPNIESLALNGTGVLKGQTPLHAPSFHAAIAGAGSMEFNVTTDDLKTVLEGTGDYVLHGKATTLMSSIMGSGSIHAYDLETTASNVTIHGSGDAEVQCKESLSAVINGSGNVFYKGEPDKVQTVKNGNGSVIKK